MGGGGEKVPGQYVSLIPPLSSTLHKTPTNNNDFENRYMGWWGSFGTPPQKGITTYTLSANRQRPLAGTMHAAVFNSWRRFKGQVLYVAPPFVVAYLVMDWAVKEYVPFFS